MLYKQFGEEKKGLKLRHKKKDRTKGLFYIQKVFSPNKMTNGRLKKILSWYDPSEDNSHP